MKYVIITDDTVEKLYGTALSQKLQIPLFSFPAGESSKTRSTKESLENTLLSAGYSRDTTILALGGGVVTDLAGFLASTFCRGVDLILIPTTLLAMVDAAIGGKTGVNTEHGKNMIGSFYHPNSVIINTAFLSTLPEKEWFNGQVEMLKAGLIADPDLFHSFSEVPLREAIFRSIEVKRRIIAQDPYEKGIRKLLNVGHTLGHAIETVSHYQIPHGEAVAQGIVLEARISYELGFLKPNILDAIEKRFPPLSFSYAIEEIIQVLKLDKKGGKFALLSDIGSAFEKKVPLDIVKKVLHDAALCSP